MCCVALEIDGSAKYGSLGMGNQKFEQRASDDLLLVLCGFLSPSKQSIDKWVLERSERSEWSGEREAKLRKRSKGSGVKEE